MSDISQKPWLRNYPEGISSNIKFDEYSSLVDMFDKTCKRFHSKKAFTNFGKSITFNQIYYKSLNLASFLQNGISRIGIIAIHTITNIILFIAIINPSLCPNISAAIIVL